MSLDSVILYVLISTDLGTDLVPFVGVHRDIVSTGFY